MSMTPSLGERQQWFLAGEAKVAPKKLRDLKGVDTKQPHSAMVAEIQILEA